MPNSAPHFEIQGGASKGAPSFVAIDWGTTSFRAYLATASGVTCESVASPRGILSVPDATFGQVLQAEIGPWLAIHGDMPVLMCGMIGSRQGWREAPYGSCPARLQDLVGGLAPVDVPGISRIAIVPGLALRGGGMPDVMRGEETQVAGAMVRLGLFEGCFLLPGTHSKWVTATGGAISGFRTYMTGEIFAALKSHTILGRLMTDGSGTRTGFETGLEASRSATGGPGALLHDVFSARTRGLMGDIGGDDLAEYLSGLLIGAEIRDAAADARNVVIIANDALAERYKRACSVYGIASSIAPSDCAVAGLAAIARTAGWIEASA